MGIFSYVKAGKKIFGKKSPTIKSVKPTFPKTKMSQALRDVKMTALKTKGSIKKGSQDMETMKGAARTYRRTILPCPSLPDRPIRPPRPKLPRAN